MVVCAEIQNRIVDIQSQSSSSAYGNRAHNDSCGPLPIKEGFEDKFEFDYQVVHLEDPKNEAELVNDFESAGNLTVPRFEYEDDVVLDSEDEGIDGSRLIRVSSSLSRNETVQKQKVKRHDLEENTAVDFHSSDQKHCDSGEQVFSNNLNGIEVGEDSSQALTRLSYCSSQEPGESTQVSALGFVDHFLSINTVNPAQRIRYGEAVRVISPPLSRIKGPQRLAKRISRKSIEDTRSFEWVDFDNQEAECNLPGKCRKTSLDFGNCTQSSAMKAQNIVELKNKGDSSLEKYEDEEASADIQFQRGTLASTLPHPRLDIYSEETCRVAMMSGKEILNNCNAEFNALLADNQFGPMVDEGSEFKDLDIGFSTQVAAEAMEALSYIPVGKNVAETLHSPENALNNDSRDLLEHQPYSGLCSPQKLGGIVRKSKHTLKSKRKFYVNCLNTFETQCDCQELDSDLTTKIKAKRGKLIKQRQLNYGETSHGSSNSATSFSLRSNAGNCQLSKRDYTNGDQDTLANLRFGSWSHLSRTRTSRNFQSHPNRSSNQNKTITAINGKSNNWIEGNQETRKPILDINSYPNSYPYGLAFQYYSDRDLIDQVCDNRGPAGRISHRTDASRSRFRRDKYHRRTSNRILQKSSSFKKLARLGISESMPDLRWKDLRKRRTMALVKVCFSQHLDEVNMKRQKRVVAQLGISIASSSPEATHFIADKFVRTRNMLEAIALGKPIVTHSWLESCGQASFFIDEKNYILRDAKKEKEIGFNLPVSLARATRRPLLKDLNVLVTPNAKPDEEVITSLVKMSQGEPVKRSQIFAGKDEKIPDDLLILSCEEDFMYCIPFLEKGVAVYSSELLLNGIVIQELEYSRHELFTDHN